jgi:hypothetical protein
MFATLARLGDEPRSVACNLSQNALGGVQPSAFCDASRPAFSLCDEFAFARAHYAPPQKTAVAPASMS